MTKNADPTAIRRLSTKRKLTLMALMAAGIGVAQTTGGASSFQTRIHDVDTAGALLITRSDHYNGYQEATYAPASPISAADGSWRFSLSGQSQRSVWLTLASQGVPLPDGYYADVEVYSKCLDANSKEVSYLGIPAGMSNNRCSFGVDFSNGPTRYRLVMNPPAYPGTGWATVTCNTTDAGGACDSWAIVPNMLAANPTVAKLYKIVNGGPVYVGAYRNTFFVSVTRPHADGFSYEPEHEF
jgi:hypothetical protein